MMESKYTDQQITELSKKVWDEKGPFGTLLNDQLSNQGEKMGLESYENRLFVMLAESEGNIFMIWLHPDFVAGRFSRPGLRLIYGSYEDMKRMHAGTNKFHYAGTVEEFRPIDAMEVKLENGKVIWSTKGFRLICQPPVWHALGEFIDRKTGQKVKLDLLFKQEIPEFWVDCAALAPGMTGRQIEAYCSGEGELIVDGKKYEIKSAPTIYENGVVPVLKWAGLKGFDWILAPGGEKLKFYAITTGAGGRQGFLYLKTNESGRIINFEDVTINHMEWWNDPETNLNVPSRWEVIMKSSTQGTFKANVFGVDRHWVILHGRVEKEILYSYDYICTFDQKFTDLDGMVVSENNAIGTVERLWPEKK